MHIYVEWWLVYVLGLTFAVLLFFVWYAGKAECNAEWREQIPEIERRAIEINEAETRDPPKRAGRPDAFGGQFDDS